MSAHTPPPPPLLLTKRVTAFLAANLSAGHLHTAALTTPSGKILAHASAQPARVLRRQCAVAASLWALQSGAGPGNTSAAAGLSPTNGRGGESSAASGSGSWRGKRPTSAAGSTDDRDESRTVTVQLESGAVFVMRRLRCGMLFVCVGGASGGEGSKGKTQQQAEGEGKVGAGAGMTPAATPTTPVAQPRDSALTPPSQQPAPGSFESSSEAESALSGGSQAAGARDNGAAVEAGTTSSVASSSAPMSGLSKAEVVGFRRQVEELARWLDGKLGLLAAPEEGSGLSNAAWDLIAA